MNRVGLKANRRATALDLKIDRECLCREDIMKPRGAVFQPEVIELMKAVLEEAAKMIPEAQRTSAMKADLATRILALAAQGDHDPARLKAAALLGVAQNSNYPSHDISLARRAV